MDSPEERTQPDDHTRATEEEDAARPHQADRAPNRAEEEAAEQHLDQTDEQERRSVAEHNEEMAEIGAEEKGEGRID